MDSQLITVLAEAIKTFHKELAQSIAAEVLSTLRKELPQLSAANNNSDKLLNMKEVAQLLQVSVSTIIKLRNEGTFPTLYIGEAVRFDRAAVLEYVRQQSKGGGNRTG